MKLRSVIAPTLLAVSDAWTIGFGVFSLAVSTVMTVILWRNRETRQDTRDFEARQHELVTKLVDERFRSMTHELNNNVNSFSMTLEELKTRLKETEQTFDMLIRAAHVQEMKGLERLEQVKDYIRDQTASRADMREHQKSVDTKFEKIMSHLADMQTQIAVVAQQAQH